jgi:hypothetical protein
VACVRRASADRGEMPETSNGGEEFEMWELIWARSRAKDDWWPCQICEVKLPFQHAALRDGIDHPNPIEYVAKVNRILFLGSGL